MFRLERGDVRHGREDVREVGARALEAVAVVDLALPSFLVAVEQVQVVVKVHVASTQVTAQQSRVRLEDGRDRQRPLAGQHEAHASLPLVKVGNHRGVGVPVDILFACRRWRITRPRHTLPAQRSVPLHSGHRHGATAGTRTSPKNHATR